MLFKASRGFVFFPISACLALCSKSFIKGGAMFACLMAIPAVDCTEDQPSSNITADNGNNRTVKHPESLPPKAMKKQCLFLFALFCTLLVPVLAYSQTTVAPFVTSEVQLMNNNGAPLAGGCIFFFAAGTSTPQPTFTDSTGTVQAANPVVLDSAGRAAIWMSALSYKIQVKTSGGVNCASGVQLWVQDNVTWQTPLAAQANLSITGTFNMTQPTAATSGVNQSSFSNCLHGTYWNGSASTDDKWCWQDVLPNGTNPTSTLTLQHTGSSGAITVDLTSSTNLKAGAVTAGSVTSGSVNNNFDFFAQGAHCDGSTDDSATFTAAMTKAGTLGGLTIVFPAGKTCFFSSTITVNHPNVSLDCQAGSSSGEQPNAAPPTCELLFASGNNVTGIDMTSTPNANIASSTKIRNLYIVGQASGAGTGNGIHVTTNAAVLEYNKITGFGNCGVSVDSSGTGANPNFWRLIQNYSVLNKGDGYCFNGTTTGNTNVGVAEQNTADTNGGWGFDLLHGTIEDPSTNQFRTNHCIGNSLGCFNVNGTNNTFLGNYAEGDGHNGMTFTANSSNNYLVGMPTFGSVSITDNGSNNTTFQQGCFSVSGTTFTPCFTNQIGLAPVPGTATPKLYIMRNGVAAANRFDIIDNASNTWLTFIPGSPNFVVMGQPNLGVTEGSCVGANSGIDQLCANSTDHALTLNNNNTGYGHVLVTGSADAKGFQSKRVAGCATGAAQFNTCDVTVTWTTAFADANYTATCNGDVVTSGVPQVEGIDISAAKAGATITVRTIALTAAAAQFTTIDCTAVHD